MSNPGKQFMYWVGIVCIFIGVIIGILTLVGTISPTKLIQIIITLFSVLGGILVLISYAQKRK